ncbi:phospho-N-acetylmuramoyl-pentapeptide-transferase [Helicobacter monodelphidis]|uniref:phospho-N-acetylmuramoyl-pentapeptide- transferase n=1 Tax=Helicobacter sp. 15-1451 TaxID=2004995 RepID=UPI000DCE27C1|nr:phospho-N-acetylmuramoyl-pentapeptide-transferase [Helicobacter sp. 15-1451]RAX57991.1 phospho-N-acetylmuramoyl-pentapeptide-transferase [Helicobacter sp. 15-1451]
MLYYLWETLNINLFNYITFRAGVGFFIAFFITLFLMPRYIRFAVAKKAEQPISDYAPKNHQNKAGTPTMGGIVIVFATLIASLFSGRLDNFYCILGMLALLLFSLVGIRDDSTKIFMRNNSGLSSKTKSFLLFLVAGFLSFSLYIYGLQTSLYIPFYKLPLFDMQGFAILFWILVLITTPHGVNVTDGLDGLVSVPSVFTLMTLCSFVYISGNIIYSNYLFYPYIQGVGEVSVVGAALLGAIIGFLWFNCHPAQVFMGDSGSLAIGGFVAYCAIISKSEFILFFAGFIFVIEAFSVIIQLTSIKIWNRKVFLMAPLHHHFEIKGWAENKIIVRFWIIALMSNLIALLSFKIR